MLDAENETNRELSAFPETDIHGYIALGRTLAYTGFLLLGVLILGASVILLWRATNGY